MEYCSAMAQDPRQARADALAGRRSTHRGGAVRAGDHPGAPLRNGSVSAAAAPPRLVARMRAGAAARRDARAGAGPRQADDGAGPSRRTGLWCLRPICGRRTGDWPWRVSTALPQVVAQARLRGRGPRTPCSRSWRTRSGRCTAEELKRLRAIAVSVAGTDQRRKAWSSSHSRGWNDVDLSALTAKIPARAGIRLLLGNDATLAGLGRGPYRRRALRCNRAALDGRRKASAARWWSTASRSTGAHGAAGEYGHIPFGDASLVCPCGARGCWDLTVDGRALARHRGDAPPADAVGYVHEIIDRPTPRAVNSPGI